MDEGLKQVNSFLVTVFNDILTIEEEQLKKSRFSDLSIKEMHTIEAIGMYHKKTSSEVAKELKVTMGTLTVAINNLEKKGYVERFRSEDDRRVVKLGLTKHGRLLYRMHERFHRLMVEKAIESLSEEERAVLLKALKNLHLYFAEFE
ncbi:MarR family transcriptional regulator [Enterococcus hirae]|jgi:DNA-binding MarR family transcriptional regulator|nr:MarR family transcriptional regulator [Enterococcaceae bacterium]MCI1920099.1 MarR family transcriptional regulator [Enterococcaceae bacterium]MDM8212750.1 MarR family transcriptional regulator [Enterococcus hirae]